MSTRSYIGMCHEDGSVEAVYCHWDGYPEGVGATLEAHYYTRNKVKSLLALGNLSILGPEIGEKHDFDSRPEGQTTAYARDRGEAGQESVRYLDEDHFDAAIEASWCDYAYLMTPLGGWLVRDVNNEARERMWLPLALVLRDAAKSD